MAMAFSMSASIARFSMVSTPGMARDLIQHWPELPGRGEDAGNSRLVGSAAGKSQTWLSCPPNVSASLDKCMSGVSMLDSSLDFPYNFSLLSGK